jgi:high-affinity K+ transport system ATPase subunit B
LLKISYILLFTPLVWICINNHTGGVFVMYLEDLLKEFVFDSEIRKMSIRTIKSYKNNNLRFFSFIKSEFGIDVNFSNQ